MIINKINIVIDFLSFNILISIKICWIHCNDIICANWFHIPIFWILNTIKTKKTNFTSLRTSKFIIIYTIENINSFKENRKILINIHFNLLITLFHFLKQFYSILQMQYIILLRNLKILFHIHTFFILLNIFYETNHYNSNNFLIKDHYKFSKNNDMLILLFYKLLNKFNS